MKLEYWIATDESGDDAYSIEQDGLFNEVDVKRIADRHISHRYNFKRVYIIDADKEDKKEGEKCTL